MGWTLVNFENEKVRNNFEKLSRTHAKCKHCDKEVQHTYMCNFLTHMEDQHKITSNYEKYQEEFDTSWKYIRERPNSPTTYHCVLCEENTENFSQHTHKDDDFTFMASYYKEWQWKYFIQEDDSTAKCYFSCKSKIILFSWDDLMNHIREDHPNLLQTMVLNFEDEDIQDSFQKISHTEAQCRECKETITHTTFIDNFFTHVQNHRDIVEIEAQNDNPSWKYIRVHIERTTYTYYCVFCKKGYASKANCLNHTNTHVDYWPGFVLFMSTFYNRWEWKYCEQVNDSKIKCYICDTQISIGFHWNTLMSHRVSHINIRNTMTLKFEDEDIREQFIKLSFTVAKCKVCNLKFTHTLIEKFKKHIHNYHNDIVKREGFIPGAEMWKYIRCYQNQIENQCVLCKEKVLSQDRMKHTHENDENYTSIRINYEQWEWKYREIKQKSDSKVKCYLCPREISIDFCKDDLMNHIGECGKKLPALSVADLRLNIQDKEILQKYKNFSNYKAQCRFCNKRIVHTNIRSITHHIINNHRHIYKLEDEIEEEDQLSRKYIMLCKNPDSPNQQCVLCKGIISNDDDYSDHENQYHKNNYTLRKILYEKWELKYGERENNDTMKCNFCQKDIPVQFYAHNLKMHLQRLHKNQDVVDTADPSSLTGIQQQDDVSIVDTADPSSLAGTQQHDVGIKDTIGASPLPGPSGSPPKKRKKDSSS